MIKLNLPKLHPAFALHATGLATTIASVLGSYEYMLIETNHDYLMSGAFAAGLGVCIYVGWEFAFNAKAIKRRLIAGSIALLAASVSAYTIYQNNLNPIITSAASEVKSAKDDAKATQNTALALVKSQIDDLTAQNATDKSEIVRLQSKSDKSTTWQVNIVNKRIQTRNDQLLQLTAQLKTVVTPVSGQDSKDTTKPAIFSTAMLVRASMYEVMTVLALLFASWVRDERKQSELAQVAPLQAATLKAESTLAKLELGLSKVVDSIALVNSAVASSEQTIHQITASSEQIISNSKHVVNQHYAAFKHAAEKLSTELSTHTNQLKSGTEQHLQELTLATVHKIETAVDGANKLMAGIDQHAQELIINTRHNLNLAAHDVAQQAVNMANEELAGTLDQAANCTSELQKQIIRANESFARANQFVPDRTHSHPIRTLFVPEGTNESTNESTNKGTNDRTKTEQNSLDLDTALTLLKERAIKPNDKGLITIDMLIAETNLGRKRAEKLRDLAIERGLGESAQSGRGIALRYIDTPSTDACTNIEPTNNIINLPNAKMRQGTNKVRIDEAKVRIEEVEA